MTGNSPAKLMNKYRLTIMFVLISVLTLGTAAFALNHLAARTAENNLVELATEQSTRDASIIAGIVNQLLVEQGTESTSQPAQLAHTIPIESQKLLDSLRVIDISLYDNTGKSLWSTSADLIAMRTVPPSVLEAASNGEISSNLGTVVIQDPQVSDPGLASSAAQPRKSDVIETYLPLLAATGDGVVGVIGVTRDVTGTLSAQIAKTRASVTAITIVSLLSVFLVLLMFIFVADLKIFRATRQKISIERELSERSMLDSLEMKRVGEMKDRFLSSITHELMTPLTSIAAFAGIIIRNREGNLGKKDIDHLQIIKRNTVQLQRLLDDLLELSVLNKGEYELSYSRFNLRQTLEEVTEAFRPAIVRKNQNIDFNYDGADAIVEADDERIRQVISNLLTNAIMYSPENTDIAVSAWISDLLFTVEVSDNGIGISDDDKEQLFTLFFRADNESTRSVAGTGIGLVSARQIVELHGGELTLESSQGKGTSIQISIPRFRTRHSIESRIIGAA
jgi:signal transduction histidine kinase